MKPITLIPYNCGWGAQDKGCAEGAQVLKQRNLEEQLQQRGLSARWAEFKTSSLEPKEQEEPTGFLTLPLVEDYCGMLHAQVSASLKKKTFPVTLGGDHSMAIGTWSAVADKHDCHGKLGLIWVDAHLDAHLPDTSPSQAYHGMPAAVLLGLGEASLRNLAAKSPVLSPEHLCFIGIRSYEEGEYQLLKKLGVRIYMMGEVHERGLAEVMAEALERVTAGTQGFGITLDLDAFDPSRAPGVGSPEEGGLLKQETLAALKGLGADERCLALEIAEYNPHHGKDGITTELVRDIIVSALG